VDWWKLATGFSKEVPMEKIALTTLSVDQLKALVANHERLGATDRPLYAEAKAELLRRAGPATAAVASKGPKERSRASRMANWTMRHGKDDAANPFSKENMTPRPR
jgi:hypothetical protein